MTDQTPSSSTPPDVQPAPRRTLMQWLQIIVGGLVTIVFAVIGIAKFATRNDLPACDSSQATDTLSEIFKEHKVEATKYDAIKGLTSDKDLVTCNAVLTLKTGGKLDIDYKMFRNDAGMRLEITRSDAKS